MMQPKIETNTVGYKLVDPTANRTQLVITDVDGTLASFWDYFVPALRDFLRHVSDQFDVPISELAEDIGRVVERHGTHEYPWLLEETAFAWKHFKDKPDQFISDFVEPFWKAMDENREKYLRPFPGVVSTLEDLKSQGIKIVALSDAPDYMARIRNKQVFDGLLDAVYALETLEPGDDAVWRPITLEHGRMRLSALKEATADLKTKLITLPKHYEKPCPHGLDMVLRDFKVFPYETIFVGDSLKKDGLVAASRGIRYVWAHYGSHLPAEYDELVNIALKPFNSEQEQEEVKDVVQDDRAPYVEAIAARYDELLKLL